jgi:Amt family ammonium transporter
MLLTGVFANGVGLVYGHLDTFKYHILALAIVGIFTFGGSFVLFKITDLISPLRVSPDEERLGLDISQHAETLQIEVVTESHPGSRKMEVAA